MGQRGLDSAGSGLGQVVGCSKHSTEPQDRAPARDEMRIQWTPRPGKQHVSYRKTFLSELTMAGQDISLVVSLVCSGPLCTARAQLYCQKQSASGPVPSTGGDFYVTLVTTLVYLKPHFRGKRTKAKNYFQSITFYDE